jgi:hypothetical protein
MKVLKIVFIALFVWCGVASSQVTTELNFDEFDLSFETVGDYNLVLFPDCYLLNDEGKPALPAKCIRVAIPLNRKIVGFTIEGKNSVEIAGEYLILPAQPLIPYDGSPPPPFVSPDSSVYNATEPWPGNIVEIKGDGYFAGLRMAKVNVFPLQYIPKKGKLILYTDLSIKFELAYSEDRCIKAKKRTQETHERYINKAKSIVVNPEDVKGFIYQPTIVLGDVPDWVRYIIITSERLESSFQPLLDWRRKQGFNPIIQTVEWINAHHPGDDLQERIKHYITRAYEVRSTEYFLLGGDKYYVPVRMTKPDPGNSELVPTDLYYAGLDGTWDADSDYVYGEYDDDEPETDEDPDVWIGRAKVSSGSQAAAWVQKILTYERNPSSNYASKDLLLMGATLWKIPGTIIIVSGGDKKDDIVWGIQQPPTMYRLYDLHYNGTPDELIGHDAAIYQLNAGYYLINHIGHGDYDKISVDPTLPLWQEVLTTSDLDALINGTAYGVFFSIACHSAAFDKGLSSCFAQHWLVNSNGGGVAYIGPSREGFASWTGATGPAECLDRNFLGNLCKEDPVPLHSSKIIGEAWGGAEVDYSGRATHATVGYWTELSMNLLGDPAMQAWIKDPLTMQVSHPTHIPIGSYTFTATVKKSNGSPLYKAHVCLYKEDDVYQIKDTDANGITTFNINTSSEGLLYVTVTIFDYHPYEGTCSVGYAKSGGAMTTEGTELPVVFELYISYPNPFSSETKIEFVLPKEAHVSLEVYDVTGRIVKTLVEKKMGIGYYLVKWDANDVPSGIYFCKIRAHTAPGTEAYTETRKLILIQ